jgi:hypothetical protein
LRALSGSRASASRIRCNSSGSTGLFLPPALTAASRAASGAFEKAVQTLREAGLVVTVVGRGTFVARA